jgi:hypothetical protein
MKSVFGKSGTTTMSLTGAFGKLPLISAHLAPPLVVSKTWPCMSADPEKPEKVT